MDNQLTVVSDIESKRWYKELVADCREIIESAEHDFADSYHALGKRILKDNDNFERTKIYGKEICQHVGESLGIGNSTLKYALQLARQFPDALELPDGTTWREVCNNILPGYGKAERDAKKKAKRDKMIADGANAPKSGESFRLIHSPIRPIFAPNRAVLKILSKTQTGRYLP